MSRSRLRIGLTQKGSDEGGSTGRTSKQIEDYHRRKRTFQYKKNDRGKVIKIEMLTGGQAKLDKNKNNRIDAQDFKILRAEKAKGRGMGLQDEKVKPGKVMKAKRGTGVLTEKGTSKTFKGFSKPFEGPQVKGKVSTIVGVKPFAKIKGQRKKFKSLEEMRQAKGFKPGESVSSFNKRRAELARAKDAAKALGPRGKIALGVGLAGVGAIQYLKSKMKKKDKKMGGGMMKKYSVGGGADMGIKKDKDRLTQRDIEKAKEIAKQKKFTRRMSVGGPASEARQRKKNIEDKAYEAGKENIFSGFRLSLKKADKQYADIPSGMKKKRNADNIKLKILKGIQGKRRPSAEIADSRREVFATERMGGGMMNKPMGYKSGTSVKVKCKLGRNKPTKMY